MIARTLPSPFRRRLLTLSALAALSFTTSTTFAAFTWTGLGADPNWSTPANWSGAAPANSFSSSFTFDGSLSTTSNNDLTGGTISGLTFNPTAAAFTLTGNAVSASGNWTNLSPNTQTISLSIISKSFNVLGNSSFNFTSDLSITNASHINNFSSTTLTFSGNVFLGNANNTTGNLILTGTGNTLFTGTIANLSTTPGDLEFGGPGTVTIAGPMNATGNTTVFNGSLVFDLSSHPSYSLNTTLYTDNANVTFTSTVPSSVSLSTLGLNAGSPGTNSFPQASTITLGGNSGITLTINTLSTAASNASLSSLTATLFDLSSSPANSLSVNHLGANVTLSNGILTTNSLAQTLLRDSNNIGFATLSGSAIIRIPDASLTPLTPSSLGDGSVNYLFSPAPGAGNISVSPAGFFYNTFTIDSSAEAATINYASNSAQGRGLLVRGNHDVTIHATSLFGIGPVISNFLPAPSALYINANFRSDSNFSVFGPGLTVYSGTTAPDATSVLSSNATPFTVNGGTFRFTSPMPLDQYYESSHGIAMDLVNGAILEIGADLSTSSTTDLSLSTGTTYGIKLFGNAGFSAYGANRTVTLGIVPAFLSWGKNNFLTTPDSADPNAYLLLSSPTSNATLILTNNIDLGGIPASRTIYVADGSAPIDARLTGTLTSTTNTTLIKAGPGTLDLTGSSTALDGGILISSGSLRLSGNAAITHNINVAANTTLDVSALTGGTSFANNAFTLATAQTLSGNGRILGNVALASSAIISPGAMPPAVSPGNFSLIPPFNSPGKLTFTGNLTFNRGTYAWQLASLSDDTSASPGLDFDQILIDGAIGDLGNAEITLDFSFLPAPDRPDQLTPDDFWSHSHTWTIIATADGGSLTGSPFIFAPPTADGKFSLSTSSTSLLLNFTPTPEPTSLLLLTPLLPLLRKRRPN